MATVTINNANTVNNVSGTLKVNNTHYYGNKGEQPSQMLTDISGQDGVSPAPCPSSLGPDPMTSRSPPQQDGSPSPNGEDLPTPIQMTGEIELQHRFLSELHAPVDAETSEDYFTLGMEHDGELNLSSSEDVTAISELKTAFCDSGTGAESPTEQFSMDDVNQSMEKGRSDQSTTHHQLSNTRDVNSSAPHIAQLRSEEQYADLNIETHQLPDIRGVNSSAPHIAQLQNGEQYADLNIETDGPSLTPPNSCMATNCSLPPLQSASSIVERELSVSGPSSLQNASDARVTQATVHCIQSTKNILAPKEVGRLFVATNSNESNIRNAPTVEKQRNSIPEYSANSSRSSEDRRSTEPQGKITVPHLMLASSPPMSLQMDGGGEQGLTKIQREREEFVFLHRDQVIPGDSTLVISVVDIKLNTAVLEDVLKEGMLPGGCWQLVQTKWLGYRNFHLTQWKAALKPSPSSPEQTLKPFLTWLCQTLLDFDIDLLGKITQRLKKECSVFLDSLSWDGGLVAILGPADPDLMDRCMESPQRETIQTILQGLSYECDLHWEWRDPVLLEEEEETEDGRPPTVQTVERAGEKESHCSISSSELLGPLQQTPSIASKVCSGSSSSPQSQEGYSAYSASSVSDSSSCSVTQLIQSIVDERCWKNEHKAFQKLELDLQQLKEQFMSSFQHEVKQREQMIQKLQYDLDRHQMEDHFKEEEAKKHQEEMKILINSMTNQLKEQGETIQELRRAAKRNEKECMEREAMEQEMKAKILMMEQELRSMQDRSSQNQQDQAKALEASVSKTQLLSEELSRQQQQFQWLQGEMMHQRQQQEQLLALLMRQQGSGSGEMTSKGCVEEDESQELGAVGGTSRNRFSSALAESERTTSKMKGKDEEMASNQIEEKINPMGTSGARLGVGAQLGDLEVAGEDRLPSQEGPPGVVSVQSGARSKVLQRQSQSDSADKGSNSGSSSSVMGMKMTSGREGSQDRNTDSAFSEQPGELTKAKEFLDSIRFTKSSVTREQHRTLLKHISSAIQEEAVPAPRAKCLDTILCIDVSDSIVSEGHLRTVKKVALDFVDGIEDLMNEMDMEENIGVVAVGGHARVVQHLTNDLTLVREAIESLDDISGGRSPFLQAIMVCLAANKNRGGTVNVAGVHKVKPRLIFITDGLPTDESQETGPDLPSNTSETRMSLVHFLSQFKHEKNRSLPEPITWVPIGHKADQKLLKSLADLTEGNLVMPGEIQSLCRYYKIQQTIGRLLKVVMNNSDFDQEDRHREILEAIASNTITPKEKEHVLSTVKTLQNQPQEQEEISDVTDFHTVFEDEIKVKNGELLALGTRVIRGPDWKWSNQDTEGPGTVIQHGRNDNWMYVKWDNGLHNAYRYGEEGKVDVVETQHHPRQISPGSDKLDYGVRVIRGLDWMKENEDGHGPGTVIRWRESDGKLQVRWDITGKICQYIYNQKVKEVQIILPEFPRHGQGFDAKTKPPDDDVKTIPMWKWRDEQRQWRLYDEATNTKLELEYQKRPTASCIITRARKDCRVSFKLMQEKAVDGGAYVEVMREMVDEERKNDLLAIEMSLQD